LDGVGFEQDEGAFHGAGVADAGVAPRRSRGEMAFAAGARAQGRPAGVGPEGLASPGSSPGSPVD
jgi:hypothetical protein